MTHGSLFSGIGGFELAARWCGFTNVFSCEIEPFNRRVLHHHFPESELHDDIKEMDATQYHGRVDIISGGFPCQPYSVAGKRLGKDDERHLWPEMLRIIREVAPTYVVGENVRGLVNWSEGMVFEEVCADLEAAGYEVQPFILPASGVGAPHRRDRVWFVAHATDSRDTPRGKGAEFKSRRSENNGVEKKRSKQTERPDGLFGFSRVAIDPNDQRTGAGFGQVQSANGEVPQRHDDAESCNTGDWDATNAQRDGLEYSTERRGVSQSEKETRQRFAGHSTTESENGNATNAKGTGEQRERITRQGQGQFNGRNSSAVPPSFDQFPTFTPICGGDDGISRELDGITFPKWRADSIKAYGNAIVPQVAYQIFDTIKQMNQ